MDRPILMQAAMVRLIRHGLKTQTRRELSPRVKCYPGDRLYVRETFGLVGDQVVYFADTTPNLQLRDETHRELPGLGAPWKPAIHMPRELSRITLHVRQVAIQKLHEITLEDCHDEGFTDLPAFQRFWAAHYKRQRWRENPYVVAITFIPELVNIDQAAGTSEWGEDRRDR